jgi:hypothetical protein
MDGNVPFEMKKPTSFWPLPTPVAPPEGRKPSPLEKLDTFKRLKVAPPLVLSS